MPTDEELLNQQVKKLELMQETFATIGWRNIVAEAEAEIEVIKDQLLRATTERDLAYLQGRAAQCDSLIHLEDTVENTLRMIHEEAERDSEEESD